MSRDKDIRACLREIITCTSHDRIHFAHSDNFRAATIKELEEIYKEESGNEIGEVLGSDLKNTISEALVRCADESADSVLVVCGTGYILPQVKNDNNSIYDIIYYYYYYYYYCYYCYHYHHHNNDNTNLCVVITTTCFSHGYCLLY